jgi:hypothetical protein
MRRWDALLAAALTPHAITLGHESEPLTRTSDDSRLADARMQDACFLIGTLMASCYPARIAGSFFFRRGGTE